MPHNDSTKGMPYSSSQNCRLLPSLPRRAVLAFLLLGSALAADTIHFTDGSYVDGQITNQDQNSITIQTPQGPRTFPKTSIRRLQYGEPSPAEMERRRKAEKDRQARIRADQERAERARLERLRLEREAADRAKLERARLDAKREQEKRERERLEREKLEREKLERQKAEQATLEREKAELQRRQQKADSTPVDPGKTQRPGFFNDTILRAAVFPGWGHRHSGRTQMGTAIGAGFLFLIGAAFLETRSANAGQIVYEKEANASYLLPLLVSAEARGVTMGWILKNNADREAAYRVHTTRRGQLLGLAVVLYTVQLGHAAYFTMQAAGAHSSTIQMGVTFHNDF
jgi:hypothetical protein